MAVVRSALARPTDTANLDAIREAVKSIEDPEERDQVLVGAMRRLWKYAKLRSVAPKLAN